MFTTFCLFKRPAPDPIGLQTKMTATFDQTSKKLDTFDQTSEKFDKSLIELRARLKQATLPNRPRDDWDMDTLLIILSECLVLMGVFMEAMGTCVKMYGYRIRMASKHKAADATSEGSPLPAASTSKVVSHPEPPLTKAALPESNRQSPEATIPPPGPKKGRKPKPKDPKKGRKPKPKDPKKGRKPKPKDPKTICGQGGHGEPQPPPIPEVQTPEKRSKGSQPSPPPEPPASQGRKKPQHCIAEENSQLTPPSESPAAEAEEGPPVTAKRGRPKQQAAKEEGRPVRRSRRQQNMTSQRRT
ncbi:hypothetical protein B0J13DRAFT_164591 [Dactylonectria estremocensis]|uniref:Uncharacterized protein n=1 Tax=Dactylonectria estremocensis TaxID=1079267 RepID=A0A9P9DIG7_9HYPO|nr:hypothetical protein B0J13DRAFT_164591 [Dactylonectria estremocensis]